MPNALSGVPTLVGREQLPSLPSSKGGGSK